MSGGGRPEQDPDIAAYLRSRGSRPAAPQGNAGTAPPPAHPVRPGVDPDVEAYLRSQQIDPASVPDAPGAPLQPQAPEVPLTEQDHPDMTQVVAAERAAAEQNIQQLQQLLQRPNISPEQRVRVERLIDKFKEHWYNPVSSNRGVINRTLRGGLHGAVSYGIMGMTDLAAAALQLPAKGAAAIGIDWPTAMQNAMMIPELRQNIAEAQEIMRTEFSEGKAGAIGAIAGTFAPELGAGAIARGATRLTAATAGGRAAVRVRNVVEGLRGPWSAANEAGLEALSRLPGVGQRIQGIMAAAKAPEATYAQRVLAQVIGSAGVDAVQVLDVATDERLSPDQRLSETLKQLGISLGSAGISEIPGIRSYLGTHADAPRDGGETPRTEAGPTKSPEEIARETLANAEADAAEAAHQEVLKKWRNRRNQQAAAGFNKENPGLKWRDLPESVKNEWRESWFKRHPEEPPARPEAAVRPADRTPTDGPSHDNAADEAYMRRLLEDPNLDPNRRALIERTLGKIDAERAGNSAANTSQPDANKPVKSAAQADRWARAHTGDKNATFAGLPEEARKRINMLRRSSVENMRRLRTEMDPATRATHFGFTPGDEAILARPEFDTEDLAIRIYEYVMTQDQLLAPEPPTWMTREFKNAVYDAIDNLNTDTPGKLPDAETVSYIISRLKLDGMVDEKGLTIAPDRVQRYAQNLYDYIQETRAQSQRDPGFDDGATADGLGMGSDDPIVRASQEALNPPKEEDHGEFFADDTQYQNFMGGIDTESTASGGQRFIDLPDMGVRIDAATWSDEKIRVYTKNMRGKPQWARDVEILDNVLKTRELTRQAQNPDTKPTKSRWSDEPTPADALPKDDAPTNPPTDGGRVFNKDATPNNLTNPDGVNLAEMKQPELDKYVERLHKERDDAVRERFTDPATGFGNLDALKFIRRQIDKRPDLTWVALDVMNLKAINDLFQYGAGNKYIKDVARIIDEVLKEKGATGLSRFFADLTKADSGPRGARSKGDEFWLVAPTGKEQEILEAIVERVNAYVRSSDYGKLMKEQHGYDLGVRGAHGSRMAEANNKLKAVKDAEKIKKHRVVKSQPQGEPKPKKGEKKVEAPRSEVPIDERIAEVERAMDDADNRLVPDSPEWQREMDRLMPLLGKLNQMKSRGIEMVRADDAPIKPDTPRVEEDVVSGEDAFHGDASKVYDDQLADLNSRYENGKVSDAEFADEQARIIARRELATGKTQAPEPDAPAPKAPKVNEENLPPQLRNTDAKVEAERIAKLMRTNVRKLTDVELMERTKIIEDKYNKAKSFGDKSATKEYGDQLTALQNEQSRRNSGPGGNGAFGLNRKGFIRVDVPRPEVVQMVFGAGLGAFLSPEGERTENAFYGSIAALGAGKAYKMWRQAQIDHRPEWRKQASKKIVRLQDAENMKPKIGPRGIALGAYQQLVNGTAAIGQVEKLAGFKDLPAHMSPRKLAEMFNRWRGIAETWLYGHGPDNVHWSLQRIVNSVDNDIEGLGILTVGLRELDLRRISQNKKTLGLSVEEALRYVNQFKDRPAYFVAAKQLTALLNKLADDAVASGLLNKTLRDAWKDENYVHIMRVFTDGLPKTGSELNPSARSKDVTAAGQPYKSLKGSDRPVLNPVEASLIFIPKVLRAMEFNTLANKFFDVVERLPPEIRDTIAKPLLRPKSDIPNEAIGQGAELAKLYDEHGLKVNPDDAVDMIHALSDHRINVTDDVITFWRNGQKVSWRVSPSMANAFRSLNGRELEMFMDRAGLLGKAMTLPAVLARVSITGNPFFIARQAIRDVWQFGINGAYDKSIMGGLIGKPLIQAAEGSILAFHKIMANHPDWQEYLSAGSNAENVVSESLRMLPGKIEAVEKLTKPVDQSRYDAVVNDITTLSPRNWLRAYVNMASAIADAGRFAAYLADRGRGADVLDALYTAKIKGGNFGQRGSNLMFQALNKMTLFLNPSIQGLESTRRAVKDDPMGYVARAVGGIAIPTAMLYFAQEGDEEIKELRTSRAGAKYWFIRLPGAGIVKFPKPLFEGQILGTGMEAMLDYAKENDPYTFEAWRGAVWNDVKLNLMPLVLSTAVSVQTNQDLNFGGNIVPEGDKDSLDPQYQARYDTAISSRWFADKLAPYTDSKFASPAAIDYTIRNLGGSSVWEIYRTVNQAVQWERTGQWPMAYEMTFVREIFAHYPSMQTGSMEKFYTMAERSQRTFGTWKYLVEQQRYDEADAYFTKNENLIALSEVYARERKRMLDMRKAIIDLQEAPPELQMSNADKNELIETYLNAMILRSQSVNEAAQSIMHITNSRTQ